MYSCLSHFLDEQDTGASVLFNCCTPGKLYDMECLNCGQVKR